MMVVATTAEDVVVASSSRDPANDVAYLRGQKKLMLHSDYLEHLDGLMEEDCANSCSSAPLSSFVDRTLREFDPAQPQLQQHIQEMTTEGHLMLSLTLRSLPEAGSGGWERLPTLNVVQLSIRPSLRYQGRGDALLDHACAAMAAKFGGSGRGAAVRVESVLDPGWAAHLVSRGWICESDPADSCGLVSVFRRV